jgi:hypothetical protein
MINQLLRAVVLGVVCIGSVPDLAVARSPYDGEWSVLIVTEQGSCDRAYRYGVQISNGQVFYQGGGPVNFSGRVTGNGNVRVMVSAGDRQALGQGRLSRNVGRGRWSGTSSTSGSCAGYWEAERRG